MKRPGKVAGIKSTNEFRELGYRLVPLPVDDVGDRTNGYTVAAISTDGFYRV